MGFFQLWNGCNQTESGNGNWKKFFKTGDKNASYGSGYSDLWDGMCSAIMSEILHRNNIRTERVLAIISYKDGSAVNVRAAPCLLWPAHIFYHVKQSNIKGLKRLLNYYINRQIENGNCRREKTKKQQYAQFLHSIARIFTGMAVTFESEYIFCWLDWDGDNILMDGGIIDYGSQRQFGLFHHEYRYDDIERFSITIIEKKAKARYIMQTFAQIVDFLITGKKKNIKLFRKH